MNGVCGALWRRVAVSAALLASLTGLARAQTTECDAGEPEVRSLQFRGNSAFRSSDLALRIITTPSEFLRRTFRVVGVKHCLDSDELRLDVGRLRIFYRRHGYFSTSVDTTVTPLKDGYGGVAVRFDIQEGQPVHVDTLTIAGVDSTIAGIVDTASLGLRTGMIFDQTVIAVAVDTIRTRLRDNGYPRADVSAASHADTVTRRATVRLDVLAGKPARIGAIRVTDNPLPGAPRRLGDSTIMRLMGVRSGDPYSERELIGAQRALYQTYLFRHVDVSVVADSAFRRGDSLVALQVTVDEDYFRNIETEEGWAVLDCFKARVQYADRNFLGDARNFVLSAQLSKIGYGQPTRIGNGGLCPAIRADTFSAKLNYFTSATLRFQSLAGLTAPTLSVYSERRSEYQAYLRNTLVGGEASFTAEPARATPIRFAYSLEYGRTEAQPALLCAVFNRCDAESRALITDHDRPLAVASAHLDRVRLDNLLSPRFGTALRLDLRASAKEIGSDENFQFVKALSDAAFYRGLGRSMTFFARLRLGSVVGRSLSLNDPVGFVPPQERLYAGGASSVRGFQQNELGNLIYIAENPPIQIGTGDTVFFRVNPVTNDPVRRVVPVGGDALIVANFEFRLRSPVLPELIQYALFADAGDVWQRGQVVGGNEHKASALWLNGLKWTPGIGVRIATPVGPFQANVGYNPFARPAGAIYYDVPPDANGFAPLYCVSPGNSIPAVRGPQGYEQVAGNTCPATFRPEQSRTFFSRLTWTFSIGPDF
jgi:outer membrane protein assembly factor BamA